MKIKINNTSPHPNPCYATEDSAGMDLRAFIDRPLVINSGEKILIPTGLFIMIPKNYEGQIRSRSGLAMRDGIIVLNSPGTIDADYRGEIKVLLYNVGEKKYIINDGDRIAQLVIHQYAKIHWDQTSVLNVTSRGQKGYGHSGIQ